MKGFCGRGSVFMAAATGFNHVSGMGGVNNQIQMGILGISCLVITIMTGDAFHSTVVIIE